MGAFGFGASLTLRGPIRRRGFDFTAGALPPGASLMRASPGTRMRGDGVVVTEAADVARFDHDPVTGALRGLLIEPAGDNLLQHSAGFGESIWSRSGVTVTSGAWAPDGSADAATITDADPDYGVILQGITGASGGLVASIYIAKDAVPASARYPLIRLSPNDLTIDTMTGAIGGGAIAGVIDAGAFWRCWTAIDAPTAAIYIFPAVGSGSLNSGYEPGAQGSITVWGAQVEAGVAPSSIIPTRTGPGNRAADMLTLDWARFGVADGPASFRYRFDDGSSQTGTSMVAGGTTIVPTDLARRHLASVEPA